MYCKVLYLGKFDNLPLIGASNRLCQMKVFWQVCQFYLFSYLYMVLQCVCKHISMLQQQLTTGPSRVVGSILKSELKRVWVQILAQAVTHHSLNGQAQSRKERWTNKEGLSLYTLTDLWYECGINNNFLTSDQNQYNRSNILRLTEDLATCAVSSIIVTLLKDISNVHNLFILCMHCAAMRNNTLSGNIRKLVVGKLLHVVRCCIIERHITFCCCICCLVLLSSKMHFIFQLFGLVTSEGVVSKKVACSLFEVA